MELQYPKKSNGLFILGKNDIDGIAAMILREYIPSALEFPQAVDIELLAEDSLFLTIRNEILQPHVLGITIFEDVDDLSKLAYAFRSSRVRTLSAGTVLISAALKGPENRRRRRYTLAHEISHWKLHRTYYSPNNQRYQFREQFIACRTNNIENTRHNAQAERYWLEWQANSLASSLLMPREPFLDYSVGLLHSFGWQYLSESKVTNDYDFILDAISGTFMISRTAAEIRLKQLGLMQKSTTHVNVYSSNDHMIV